MRTQASHRSRRRGPLLATIAVAGLLLSGCADFDGSAAAETEWSEAPELTPEQGPQPEAPRTPAATEGPSSVPPPDGCTDHDQAVIATCLDTAVAVAAFPTGAAPSGVAAEQNSGKVMRVEEGKKPKPLTTLKVNTAGDGGLTGIALSPSYAEDQLIFAYVTTASDNRIVRFAPGQQPKPVLTGIPKGKTGNRGAIAASGDGALLVATGDAGDAKAASDPKSLAGKVLRINGSGKAAKGNPTSGSRVIASGVHTPGGLCAAEDGSRAWITDRGEDADAIYLITPGEALSSPVWTWKDKPGVAGCADSEAGVAVATAKAGNLQYLPVDEDATATGKPEVAFDGEGGYGRLAGMDVLGEGIAMVGTVNKAGGEPVASDDRVVLLPVQPTPAGGGKD
ncbi:MAG: glucose dehydrogenase [Actinophytocola sp.]|nr:glucose dehydrogenase [Actinophytocola sp.]